MSIAHTPVDTPSHENLLSLLRNRRLKEAMEQLEELLRQHPNWALEERLERAKTSYTYMLLYLRQGVDDATRGTMHRELLAEVWMLADLSRLPATSQSHAVHAPDAEARLQTLEACKDNLDVARMLPEGHESFRALLRKRAETADALFFHLLPAGEWSKSEAAWAARLLTSSQLMPGDLCLLTAAVSLSLLRCFDVQKLTWLLQGCFHTDSAVRTRALTGAVLAMQQHAERLPLYPRLHVIMESLCEEETNCQLLTHLYLQLLRAQETEQVGRKIKEEIVPELMRSSQFMRHATGLGETDQGADDYNPDWMKQGKVEEKLAEMSSLQREGADIYMATFAQAKRAPFFSTLPHWFLPFDTLHPSVATLFKQGTDRLLLQMMEGGMFCDSDRYSFCFLLHSLPETQRANLYAQMLPPEAQELLKESVRQHREESRTMRLLINHYLQDLYRYWQLGPQHEEYPNPFAQEICLHQLPLLQSVLRTPHVLRQVADFHFTHTHYAAAYRFYMELEELSGQEGSDAELLQREGYCLQKLGRYGEAIACYKQADLLLSDDLWTLRHLASCARQMGDYAQAVAYYLRLESLQPDHVSLLYFTGCALVDADRPQEAINRFFKMNYLSPDNPKAWRGIAWCSLVLGHVEQASVYYDKLLEKGKEPCDLLNAGHAFLLQGRMEEALSHYRQARQLEGNHNFHAHFMADKATLVRLGIREEEIPLLIDLVM